MPVAEAASADRAGIASTTGAVEKLLQSLVKTSKALRLYQPGNALSDHLEDAFFSDLSVHLDEQGALELGVREFELRWNGDVVYENHDRKDSLATLLYRDGIRWLSFHPGLRREELHAFLYCLNRAASLTSDLDDLVTLLWSHDFRSIRYVAVNELSTETKGSSLEGQLACGSLGGVGGVPGMGGSGGSGGSGRPGGVVAPDAVSLKDLPQPAAHLPTEACRLTGKEVRELRAEVLEEEAVDPNLAAIELALELTNDEESEEERQRLAEQLVAILRRRLMDGEPGTVAECVRHLGSFTTEAFADSEPARRLHSHVMRAVGEHDFLEAFIEQAERSRTFKPEDLTAYLAGQGPEALPCLIPLMGRPRTPAFRRAVTEAVMAAGEKSLGLLSQCLAPAARPGDPSFLSEAFHLMSHLDGERSLSCLVDLLEAEETPVRRQTARALGRFEHPGVDGLCVQLLGDEDQEVRAAALDALVRHGRRESARPLFERVVRAPGFGERPLAEKRRTLAAIARLGGEEALEWFSELLRQLGSRWFVAQKEREILEAAVHGLRKIDTESARDLLHDLAASGNRFLRAACTRALGEKET